jgi:hypothetical protein
MSSRLRSLQRRNLVLVVILLVLGVILLVRPDTVTSVSKSSLPLLFPDFEASSVRRIELEQAAGPGKPVKRLVLQMTGGQGKWTLASHHDYPTQAGAERLLDAIKSARLRNEVTRRKATFDKYKGADGWIHVNVLDTRGKSVLTFQLGRYAYPETFILLGKGDAAHIVKAVNITPGAARPEVASWIETRIWPTLTAAHMIRIDVQQAGDKAPLTIVKRGEPASDIEVGAPEKSKDPQKVWWMVSPKEGDAKKLAVEDLAREFTGMLIQDIVAGDASGKDEARYGFDTPAVKAVFYEKVKDKVGKHRLVVGKKTEDGKGWYVRREGAPWVFRVGLTSVSRLRQLPTEYVAPPEKKKAGKDEGAKGAPKKDAGKKDGSKKDAAPAATPGKDEPKKDAAPKDGGKKDAAPKDGGKKDAAPKDGGKKDGTPKDAPK